MFVKNVSQQFEKSLHGPKELRENNIVIVSSKQHRFRMAWCCSVHYLCSKSHLCQTIMILFYSTYKDFDSLQIKIVKMLSCFMQSERLNDSF